MRICDRCKDDKGVTQVRLSLHSVFVDGGTEKAASLRSYDADLCSCCVASLKETKLAQLWLSFLKLPQG
jgi:hypothetical protein